MCDNIRHTDVRSKFKIEEVLTKQLKLYHTSLNNTINKGEIQMTIKRTITKDDYTKKENVNDLIILMLWSRFSKCGLAQSYCSTEDKDINIDIDCTDDIKLFTCKPGDELILLTFEFNHGETPAVQQVFDLAVKFCTNFYSKKHILFAVHDDTKVPHCHFLIRNFSGKSFDLMSAEMSELIDLLTDDIKSCGVNYLELVEEIEEDEVK